MTKEDVEQISSFIKTCEQTNESERKFNKEHDEMFFERTRSLFFEFIFIPAILC